MYLQSITSMYTHIFTFFFILPKTHKILYTNTLKHIIEIYAKCTTKLSYKLNKVQSRLYFMYKFTLIR